MSGQAIISQATPVMLELLRGSQQLLDVFGHLFSFQNDIFSAGEGGVWLPQLPLFMVPSRLLLTAAAHAENKTLLRTWEPWFLGKMTGTAAETNLSETSYVCVLS